MAREHTQLVPRRWPEPKKREVRKLFYEWYDVPEIARRTGVPKRTIDNWVYDDRLRERRAQLARSLDDEIEELKQKSVVTVSQTLSTASKLLERIETWVDESKAPEALYDSEMAIQLERVANAFDKALNPVLRLLGK